MRGFCFFTFNSLLQFRPFLNSPLEKFRQSFLGFDLILFNMLPSLKRAIFIFSILLDIAWFVLMENLPVFVINSCFLNNCRNTSWFITETALLFVANISSPWLFLLSSLSNSTYALIEYSSFFWWILLILSTAFWYSVPTWICWNSAFFFLSASLS